MGLLGKPPILGNPQLERHDAENHKFGGSRRVATRRVCQDNSIQDHRTIKNVKVCATLTHSMECFGIIISTNRM